VKLRSDAVVPYLDDQCFVLLDVSQSHYQDSTGTAHVPPKVLARFRGGWPFDVPAGTYVDVKALPASARWQKPRLLAEVDCELFAKTDEALASWLHQEPPASD
jgi:hypothetical protein